MHWTQEYPKAEGWYWIKVGFGGGSGMDYFYPHNEGKFCVQDVDYNLYGEECFEGYYFSNEPIKEPEEKIMMWTRTKPTLVGYYFYRDRNSDHEVVPVDFSYDGENLHYWDEFDKSWLPVEFCDPTIEWSSEPIAFPQESKKENPWPNYGKEGK